MTNPTPARLMPLSLGLVLLTGACSANHAPLAPTAMAKTPALACPWLDGEHYRVPAKLADAPGAASLPSAKSITGCAIIRFRVAADGSVSSPALRAANPLNAGPSALAALRNMRFQPARKPDTQFVIRLDLRRNSVDHVTVTTETRGHGMLTGDYS